MAAEDERTAQHEGPMSLAATSQNHQGNPDDASIVFSKSERVFPNMSFDFQDTGEDRSLTARMIADHQITHVVMPHVIADADAKRAAAHDLQNRFKFVWQLSGTHHFEDRHQSLTLSPGEMMIVSVGRTYRLEMGENCEALLLFFDPASFPAWQEIVHRDMSKVIDACGAVAASAAAASALLRHARGGRADALAVRSVVELALSSLERDDGAPPRLPPSLQRARLLIGRNIGDATYGPDALAKDLGVCRRSLYSLFGRLGLSPAAYIKRQRLEHARNEILSGRNRQVSLSTIALENGFPDSSSFSHAFKAVYGVTPSTLRLRRKLI
jgi:AraC family transcriptional regulator, positive regulator of tynA and feaB